MAVIEIQRILANLRFLVVVDFGITHIGISEEDNVEVIHKQSVGTTTPVEKLVYDSFLLSDVLLLLNELETK